MAVMRGNRVGGNWLIKWDEVKKIPWYSDRLTHRKRVTAELDDSYFRLMTIKHSISKIEWASNDYISQLSSTSQLNWVPVPVEFDAQGASGVGVPGLLEWDVVGKAKPGRGCTREPRWGLGTWEVADKM